MPPILAQKDFLRLAAFGDFLACFADTGGFKFEPVLLFMYLRPAADKPPDGLLCFFRIFRATFFPFFQ